MAATHANVTVLLNKGDGTFAAQRRVGVSKFVHVPPHLRSDDEDRVTSLALGDLDGDGDLDMAVGHTHGRHVTVLLNRGDGPFRADFDVGFARDVALVDLDSDGELGWLDRLRRDRAARQRPGRFSFPGNFAAGSGTIHLTFGDLNDGDLDMVVSNNTSNDVSMLLGNGDGSFAAQKSFPTGENPMRHRAIWTAMGILT